jgi:long-chain acyl-CoA synthetase
VFHQTPPFADTLSALLLRFASAHRKQTAFMVKENGAWKGVSTSQFTVAVEELFFGLRALGVGAGQRIAIISENRIEWAIADFAIAASGAVSVPVYPTLSSEQIQYILRNCGATMVLVSNVAQMDKIEAARKKLPRLNGVIVFDPSVYRVGAIHFETVLRAGRQAMCDAPHEFSQAAMRVVGSDLATIIYTSGTTGSPKGVMLTHRNLMSNVRATGELLPLGPGDLELSFLPLAHVFQRHVDYAALHAGSAIAYSSDLNRVLDDMAQLRPTFGAGVPRFFEKIHARVLAEVSRAGRLRERAFHQSVAVRQPVLRRVADRVVLEKIRRRFGGRIRWFISGGAPLDPAIAEFFGAIGMPIIEGYGMTEASPVITFSAPGEERIGRVGHPVRGVEVRIAADGEILVSGPNVMVGYYKLPAETKRALRDGWLHTGDLGKLDKSGYLQITGRKKDLIVTSTGRKVAPQLIEARLQRIPFFEHVVVLGEGRRFITALVTPNYEALAQYARAHGILYARPNQLIHHPEIYDMVMQEIGRCTQDFAEYERVKRIAFLDAPFSVSSGDLTPTLKVRREAIARKYRDRVELLYAA